MIYILSWTTKKQQKKLSRLLHLKLKNIQELAQKFKDFFETVWSLYLFWNSGKNKITDSLLHREAVIH